MTKIKYEQFLFFVKSGIGKQKESKISNSIDWVQLKDLADRHGLSAVVLDGLNTVQKVKELRAQVNLPFELKLGWIGNVLQNYEQRYKQYEQAIGSLATFYNESDYKMMVLKGYACSLDWPKPEHRPCGDIDIWLFGQQKEADKALLNENDNHNDNSIEIDNSHHHHTVFEWQGFTVENHYDFVNVHARRSSKALEEVFKELGKDDSHFVEMVDTSTGSATMVYLPSPNLHALFLIRHMVAHFTGAEISLRQVLDWAFFVNKHTLEVDWKWLLELLEKYHMKDFFNCINAICVEDLGFEPSMFPYVQFNPLLKEKVLSDILNPRFPRKEPHRLLPRLVFKYRRWKGNAWKHEMCYNESLWSGFWYGIWAKLLKPASF